MLGGRLGGGSGNVMPQRMGVAWLLSERLESMSLKGQSHWCFMPESLLDMECFC